MAAPVYIIETTMEKEDYRKFLYTASFLKNGYTIPLIGALTLFGAIVIGWTNDLFTFPGVALLWAVLFVCSTAMICYRIERKNKQRLRTDKTGTFGSKSVLKFYDDHLVMENPSAEATMSLTYRQFYQLLESKDYFIFYFNSHQASLLRKKDLQDTAAFRGFIMDKFNSSYKSICCKNPI